MTAAAVTVKIGAPAAHLAALPAPCRCRCGCHAAPRATAAYNCAALPLYRATRNAAYGIAAFAASYQDLSLAHDLAALRIAYGARAALGAFGDIACLISRMAAARGCRRHLAPRDAARAGLPYAGVMRGK